jgi:hypothetical protein
MERILGSLPGGGTRGDTATPCREVQGVVYYGARPSWVEPQIRLPVEAGFAPYQLKRRHDESLSWEGARSHQAMRVL